MSELHTPRDATSVDLGFALEGLRLLGVDVAKPDTIMSVHVGPRSVTVTRTRLNGNGRPVMAGDDEVATEQTVIAIERHEDDA